MESGTKELSATRPRGRRATALIPVLSFFVRIAAGIAGFAAAAISATGVVHRASAPIGCSAGSSDPNLPDFATKTDATLDNCARLRIVNTNKFAP